MKYIALCYKKFTEAEEFLTNLFLIAITFWFFYQRVRSRAQLRHFRKLTFSAMPHL